MSYTDRHAAKRVAVRVDDYGAAAVQTTPARRDIRPVVREEEASSGTEYHRGNKNPSQPPNHSAIPTGALSARSQQQANTRVTAGRKQPVLSTTVVAAAAPKKASPQLAVIPVEASIVNKFVVTGSAKKTDVDSDGRPDATTRATERAASSSSKDLPKHSSTALEAMLLRRAVVTTTPISSTTPNPPPLFSSSVVKVTETATQGPRGPPGREDVLGERSSSFCLSSSAPTLTAVQFAAPPRLRLNHLSGSDVPLSPGNADRSPMSVCVDETEMSRRSPPEGSPSGLTSTERRRLEPLVRSREEELCELESFVQALIPGGGGAVRGGEGRSRRGESSSEESTTVAGMEGIKDTRFALRRHLAQAEGDEGWKDPPVRKSRDQDGSSACVPGGQDSASMERIAPLRPTAMMEEDAGRDRSAAQSVHGPHQTLGVRALLMQAVDDAAKGHPISPVSVLPTRGRDLDGSQGQEHIVPFDSTTEWIFERRVASRADGEDDDLAADDADAPSHRSAPWIDGNDNQEDSAATPRPALDVLAHPPLHVGLTSGFDRRHESADDDAAADDLRPANNYEASADNERNGMGVTEADVSDHALRPISICSLQEVMRVAEGEFRDGVALLNAVQQLLRRMAWAAACFKGGENRTRRHQNGRRRPAVDASNDDSSTTTTEDDADDVRQPNHGHVDEGGNDHGPRHDPCRRGLVPRTQLGQSAAVGIRQVVMEAKGSTANPHAAPHLCTRAIRREWVLRVRSVSLLPTILWARNTIRARGWLLWAKWRAAQRQVAIQHWALSNEARWQALFRPVALRRPSDWRGATTQEREACGGGDRWPPISTTRWVPRAWQQAEEPQRSAAPNRGVTTSNVCEALLRSWYVWRGRWAMRIQRVSRVAAPIVAYWVTFTASRLRARRLVSTFRDDLCRRRHAWIGVLAGQGRRCLQRWLAKWQERHRVRQRASARLRVGIHIAEELDSRAPHPVQQARGGASVAALRDDDTSIVVCPTVTAAEESKSHSNALRPSPSPKPTANLTPVVPSENAYGLSHVDAPAHRSGTTDGDNPSVLVRGQPTAEHGHRATLLQKVWGAWRSHGIATAAHRSFLLRRGMRRWSEALRATIFQHPMWPCGNSQDASGAPGRSVPLPAVLVRRVAACFSRWITLAGVSCAARALQRRWVWRRWRRAMWGRSAGARADLCCTLIRSRRVVRSWFDRLRQRQHQVRLLSFCGDICRQAVQRAVTQRWKRRWLARIVWRRALAGPGEIHSGVGPLDHSFARGTICGLIDSSIELSRLSTAST